MSDQARVVIIGGGIVGCSVLYGLAKLGWTDTLLIERLRLTAGSTWHAAGNVTYFGHNTALTKLYVDSVKNYLEAERESGQPVGFHPAGSLRLATTVGELASYRELESDYDALGVEYRIVTPKEIEQIHPLLVTSNIHGAAYTPKDGHVDAAGATHALARAACLRGARVKTNCPVQELRQTGNGEWCIRTPDGEVKAQHLVVAASFWSRELVQNLGLKLPLYALEHHEIITESVRALEQLDFEVPTVRDPYAPSNTRQEGKGLLCGVYESAPKPWAVEGIPADFGEQLLVTDMERLEPHLQRVIERIPAFGEVGIKVVSNGPICYTPDGGPLLGPVFNFPGLWLATGFCVGIGTGGGSGEYLANWMVNEMPPYDLPMVYPSRFSNTLSRQACLDAIVKIYAQGYSAAVSRY